MQRKTQDIAKQREVLHHKANIPSHDSSSINIPGQAKAQVYISTAPPSPPLSYPTIQFERPQLASVAAGPDQTRDSKEIQ